jgi:hypothetical protein
VAGAALLTDYVLTVPSRSPPVSSRSRRPRPHSASHQLALSLACVALLTVGNLRGVRESGLLFAFPTYGFIAILYLTLGIGVAKCTSGTCPVATVPHPLVAGTGTLGVFLLLKAFSSGAVALTGVESISNGVTAFRRPQSQNAARTLYVMAVIAISFFVTVSWLAVKMDARPSSTTSVLSQIARGAFPAGSPGSVGYYLVQAFTLAILVLAANTSYQGFPRLAALLARDRFLPSQFVNLGDRLAYSNGIIVPGRARHAPAGRLPGERQLADPPLRDRRLHRVHARAVGHGAALAEDPRARLALAGGAERGRPPRRPALVTVVVVVTKFLDGAWMVLIAIPLLVLAFYGVRAHYRAVGRRLRAKGASGPLQPRGREQRRALRGAARRRHTRGALVRPDDLEGVPARDPRAVSPAAIRASARASSTGPTATRGSRSCPSDGDPLDTVLEEIWAIPQGESRYVTVVIPELFRKPSLLSAVMRRSTFSLKLGLLREPGVAVTDVPKLAEDDVLPKRAEVVVPVSGVNAASLRALLYARSLGIRETRAVYFAEDDDEVGAIQDDWRRFPTGLPLEIVEAPFRDVGTPLLTYLRGITADPDAVAVVVMPELVVRGTDRCCTTSERST